MARWWWCYDRRVAVFTALSMSTPVLAAFGAVFIYTTNVRAIAVTAFVVAPVLLVPIGLLRSAFPSDPDGRLVPHTADDEVYPHWSVALHRLLFDSLYTIISAAIAHAITAAFEPQVASNPFAAHVSLPFPRLTEWISLLIPCVSMVWWAVEHPAELSHSRELLQADGAHGGPGGSVLWASQCACGILVLALTVVPPLRKSALKRARAPTACALGIQSQVPPTPA